jgi:hypothetical protein
MSFLVFLQPIKKFLVVGISRSFGVPRAAHLPHLHYKQWRTFYYDILFGYTAPRRVLCFLSIEIQTHLGKVGIHSARRKALKASAIHPWTKNRRRRSYRISLEALPAMLSENRL